MVEATLTAEGLERVRKLPLVHQMPAAVFSISGPGALQCLQGLVTNDLAKPPDGSLIYGALLTPKGLIVLDCWIIKEAGRFLFVTDLEARTIAADLFRKLLPPRLAKVTDLSGEWQVYRALNVVPEPMTTLTVVARAAAGSPFSALILGPVDAVAHTLKAMAVHGARTATDDEWQAARILAGWPQRGAEIDEKTLVQEVRFDENGGVSYDKGCYTGQETVARLHFRGHTNRDLRGLSFSGTEAPADGKVMLGEKEVGSVRSILSLPTARLALALVRREVETGQVVTAGGVPATVVALPFP